MKSDCEITGAAIVSTHGTLRGSIAIHDGRIVGLLAEPTGTAVRTIDATGLLALPGMIDQHVHFMDPGPTEREDFPHGSAAAAVGGVTTVVEHTHATPVLDVPVLREKLEHLRERSVVDYGLAAHVFPHTVENVRDLWAAGIAMFKAFTCTTHGVPALLSDDLLRFFRALSEVGARSLVHCEDEFITEDNEELLHAAGRNDYGVIVDWRSPEAELVATNTVALLARLTGAAITIAHASQASVVALAQRERRLGGQLSVESCPQYLYLTAGDVLAHGPTRKFTPPARDASAHGPLWECLRRGEIDIIASDHAPSTLEQKGAGSIWDCPFGVPGVETTLTMLLDAASRGWMTMEQIATVYSANPARLLGLYPRKGAIQVGSDADIVLVDPNAAHVLRNEDIISKAGWTPYAGLTVTGRPVMTLLRGKVVAEEGRVTAAPGTGCFVPGPGATAGRCGR